MRLWLFVAIMSLFVPVFVLFATAEGADVTGGASAPKSGIVGPTAKKTRKPHTAAQKPAADPKSAATRPPDDATAAREATKDPEFKARNAVIPP